MHVLYNLEFTYSNGFIILNKNIWFFKTLILYHKYDHQSMGWPI